MQFCEECGNLLLPRKKGKVLFCRVCKEEFKAKSGSADEYRIKRKYMKSKQQNMTAIIEEEYHNPRISAEDRKGLEDYFVGSGD